jgi:rod shape-determining protein MreC
LNSRIPVTIAPRNVQAMMTGDNSANPILNLMSHTVTLHAGEQVTSSGDGGLLPAGLPIGTVVSDGAGGWRVSLLADAAASQDVEILNFSKPPEAPPPTAQLPAEAAGLKPQAPPPPQTAAAPTPPASVVPPKPKPATPAAPAAEPAEDEDR